MINVDLKKIRRVLSYIATSTMAVILWTVWVKEHPSVHVDAEKPALESMGVADRTFVPNTFSQNASKNSENSDSIKTSTDCVSVKTDVLNLKISLLNGDVVSADLPLYPTSVKSTTPTSILNNSVFNNDKSKIYYAQSGLTNTDSILYKSNASYYRLEPGKDKLEVVFNGVTKEGLSITKIFTIQRGDYAIKVKYLIKNEGDKIWSGSLFNQFIRNKPEGGGSVLYSSSYNGASISSDKKIYQKITYKDMAKSNLAQTSPGGWVSMQQHYFLSAWIPDDKEKNNFFYSHVKQAENTDNSVYTIGFVSPELILKPGQASTVSSVLYIGPEIAGTLKKLAPGLDRTIDYGVLWWFSITIFWLMNLIHYVLGNWGWSIVLTTIIIKCILYPLSATSFRSMARMRELQPKMQQLKEKFSDDRQAMSRATMELYRKEKINPLGGCLPMIIQIPIFIALYYVIIESVQLRQAPFIFWIHDLSTKDPYYVLPILMGISMFVQQKLTPSSLDPAQAKIMLFIPVVFTFFFFTFPSGLTLYWFVNNCMQIAQQYFVTKTPLLKNQKKHKKTGQ